MKHLYFFLLGLMAFTATAQLQINTPDPSYYCDQDGDGAMTINLGDFNAGILGSNSPAEYSVKYFLTEEHAQQNTLQLPYLYTLTISSTPQQIFVRVTEIEDTDNFAITALTISILPVPDAVTLPVINSSNCTGGVYDLTLNNNLYNPLQEVSFYATETDANAGTNAIANPTFYVTSQTIVWVRVANITTDTSIPVCYIILQQQLSYNSNFLIVSVSIDGQTAIVNTTGAIPVTYSIVSGPPSGSYPTPYQTSNTFTNLQPGTYTIRVQDMCGNLYYNTFMITDLDAPTGETSQTFTEGQTLADLEVSGDAIEWYDAPTGGTILPLTTPLVDNTTYYAESSAGSTLRAIRLAVTVHLILGTGSNTLPALSYYPNPVKNVLNINNATPINNVAVYNTLGQQVLNNAINTTETDLDLSALGNGIYFVKVHAGEGSKTIRIVKE